MKYLFLISFAAQAQFNDTFSLTFGYSMGVLNDSSANTLTFMDIDYDSVPGYIYCDRSGHVIMNDDTLITNPEFVKLLHFIVIRQINYEYDYLKKREKELKERSNWFEKSMDFYYDMTQELLCIMQESYNRTGKILKKQ